MARIREQLSDFPTLQKALRQTETRLCDVGCSRVMVATETQAEFKRQELQAHNVVRKHPLVGQRTPVHGRRHID